MTERHQFSNTPVPSTSSLFNSEVECVALSGMVIEERLSEEPNKTTDEDVHVQEWTDNVSYTSSEEDLNDECQTEEGLEIASPDDTCAGTFGNVVVKNSSDVQFGNNTYYHGPVTIKQFVYKGAQDGQLSIENGGKYNSGFQDECVIDSPSDCIKSDKNVDDVISNTNNISSNNSQHNKSGQWLKYIQNHRWFFIISLAVLLIVSLVLLIVIIINKQEYKSSVIVQNDGVDEPDIIAPVDLPTDPESNRTLSGKLKIISRVGWLAQPPTEKATPLKHPVPYVIILHTATENCSAQATCTLHVRLTQTYHIESNGWWDIAYNFLVGGDGLAYEGRGWFGVGANVYGYNTKCIGIAFIGTFNTILPPPQQILAAQQLIALGVKKGYIASNYKVLAHRQLSPTQSPGEALYENIKTWPHWSPTP
ncbi:Peptidoglycan recognition protein LE [Carabus blaptoides fortunei]